MEIEKYIWSYDFKKSCEEYVLITKWMQAEWQCNVKWRGEHKWERDKKRAVKWISPRSVRQRRYCVLVADRYSRSVNFIVFFHVSEREEVLALLQYQRSWKRMYVRVWYLCVCSTIVLMCWCVGGDELQRSFHIYDWEKTSRMTKDFINV